MQEARRKLQGLEDDYPAASWLPVICQNPALEPLTWLQLGGGAPCPYRSLEAFREEDAAFFHGRESVTERLAAAVKKRPLVSIIGTSGSGKSSVVFAGLIPRLRTSMAVQIAAFRPGQNPNLILQDYPPTLLLAMTREELEQAIIQPAAEMNVRLEEGLTNRLIDEVKDQPGRLPLLEFTLTQLWSNRKDGWLSHQVYEKIGGVEEALANHAEGEYAQLGETDRKRAERVFMQLVSPGEGTEDTRRLATREEVKEENWNLVTHLASCRLVVTNRNASTGIEMVELVHEALIKSWGRLEQWMRAGGEFRRWQEQLRAAMRQWESNGGNSDGTRFKLIPNRWESNSKERLARLLDAAEHLTGAPELVVEVLSPGEQNIQRDRQLKLKLYSQQGVQEYWIVDKDLRQVQVYRRDNAVLTLALTLQETDAPTSPLLPAFSHPLTRIFGQNRSP